MSVTLYWKERLEAGCPVWAPELRIKNLTIRPRKGFGLDGWPNSISRQVIYQDYLRWHKRAYVTAWKANGVGAADLPRNTDELGFYSTVAPWLYVVNKDRQVKLMKRPDCESREIAASRYFVRLSTLEHHIAVYELLTGVRVHTYAPYFDQVRFEVMRDSSKAFNDRIDMLRDRTYKQLGISTP